MTNKHAKLWAAARRLWFKNHPADHYICHWCGIWLQPEETTLDHVLARSRRPDLRYVQSNLVPCCWSCNGKKGSTEWENGEEASPSQEDGNEIIL